MRRIGLLLAILIALALLAAVARVAISLVAVEPPPRWTSDGNDTYGDPLPTGAIARLGTVRFRSTTWTNLVWLDDERLASGGFDNEIVVWDAATGERVQVLDGHREKLVTSPERWSWRQWRRVLRGRRVPSSPDSLDELRLLTDGHTTISTGESIRIWDLDTGAGRLVAWPRGGNVTGFALRDDERTLVYYWVESLRRFDIGTGRELERIPVDEAAFQWRRAVLPDGSGLVGTDESGNLRLIDTHSGKVSGIGVDDLPGRVTQCAVSADGSTLWGLWGTWPEADAEDRTVQSSAFRLDLEAQGSSSPLPLGPSAGWLSIVLSPDEALVAVGAPLDKIIEVRDARTWSVVRRIDSSPRTPAVLAFSPDSRRLAWRDANSVAVLDLSSPEGVAPPDAPASPIKAVCFGDERSVVTLSERGQLRGWGVAPTEALWGPREEPWIERLVPGSEGRVIAFGAHRADTIDAASGRTVSSRELSDGGSSVRAAGPGGTLVVRTSDALALLVCEDDPPRPIVGLPPSTAVELEPLLSCRAFDPVTGNVLLLDETRTPTEHEGSYRTRHRLRLRGSGTSEDLWAAEGEYCDVAVIAGDLVATGAGSGEIRLFDDTGSRIRRIRAAHDGHYSRYGPWGVLALAVSPDGTRLASGGADHVVRIWSLPDGRALRTLRGHGGRVNALDWSPDGTLVVSGSDDTTALVWSVSPTTDK